MTLHASETLPAQFAHASIQPPVIEVHNLEKRYASGPTAVASVSFDVRKGEFVALLGPSGCGKSTILNMVAGLIRTSSGQITVNREPVVFEGANPKIGYVFQKDTVFPWRTVAQNIGYGLELTGVGREERQARVKAMIAHAGLVGFEDAFPRTLSGGMRQRVALMRTLITRPEVLLMDEPFGALDTHTKLDMHKILLDIWEQEKQTVIFVTHDLGEALTLADRIILLSARPGRIKEIFPVPFARPREAVALRESRAFADAYSHIWHSLGEEFNKGRSS